VLFDPCSAHPAVVWMRYDDQGQLAGLAYSDKTAERQLGHVQGVAEASSHPGRASGFNGRFPCTANPAAIGYFLAAMAWSTLW